MKKIIIAFDVDGTLINNEITYGGIEKINTNDRIVELLKILSSFKNTKIIVWSGRGKEWAETICDIHGLNKYVDGCASKNHIGKDENGKHKFAPDIVPDICIDDIEACELGLLNLIVHEKGKYPRHI